jgi:hypothetical protein
MPDLFKILREFAGPQIRVLHEITNTSLKKEQAVGHIILVDVQCS